MKAAQGLWAIPLFLSICATTDPAQADEAHSESRPLIILAAREGGGGGTSRMDGIDLPGFDLPNQPLLLPSPFPDMCKASCDNDPQCKAWTYVKLGVQTWISRDKAVCWLKHSVPARKNNPNTISGIKQAPPLAPPEISMTEMDNVKFVNAKPYDSFPLDYAYQLVGCKSRCEGKTDCYAWSFLRPQLPWGKYTCMFYSRYPSSVRDTCCISGYKKVKGAGPALGQPPPSPAEYYVYYRTGEFSCCKDSKTGWVPHPIHVGQVRQWLADYVKLGGPFASDAEAKKWACNRPVNYHSWSGNWAHFGGRQFTGLPCRVNP